MDKVLSWASVRMREGSTWVGLAMIAITIGSDPMQAMHLAQAISFIVGGGLIAAGPVPSGPGDGSEEQS
ncbi:MAG: hypothetical protein SNJ63_06115 [Sphingomonadaceae bacterium]